MDFEHGLNLAVKRLRTVLGDSAEHSLYIETLTRVGYRFIAPLEQMASSSNQARSRMGMRWKVIIPAAIAVVAAVAITYLSFRRPPKLTDKDTIVLADITNTAGDSVFDGTLRKGLAEELEQSPYLNIVSDERMQQTLRMMGQPADTRLTPEMTREICER